MADRDLALRHADRQAKATALRTLTQYPEWELYRLELEQMEARWMEKMLGGTTTDFPYSQCFINGLRTAAHLPQAFLDSLASITS